MAGLFQWAKSTVSSVSNQSEASTTNSTFNSVANNSTSSDDDQEQEQDDDDLNQLPNQQQIKATLQGTHQDLQHPQFKILHQTPNSKSVHQLQKSNINPPNSAPVNNRSNNNQFNNSQL